MKDNILRQATHKFLVNTAKLILVLSITIIFGFIWTEFYLKNFEDLCSINIYYTTIIIYMLLFLNYGGIYKAFVISINRKSEMIYSICLAAFFTNLTIYVILSALSGKLVNPGHMFVTFIIQIVIAVIWSVLSQNCYYKIFKAKKTIIIYENNNIVDKLIYKYNLNKKFKVLNKYSIDDCINNKMKELKYADIVFIQDVNNKNRNEIIKYCIKNNTKICIFPKINDIILKGADSKNLFNMPILEFDGYCPTLTYLIVKRLADIILSLTALIVFSPIFLITAIAIKREDGGPVFYKQTRLTKDYKEFEILKFRSMRVDAEKNLGAVLSTGDKDPRVTNVGRKIRKFRIDELPQLINILKGEMSIVGPRPERPELMEEIEKEVPDFGLRLQVKAGLTGYAQVYGKYNTKPYSKLQMDLIYISKAGILEDIIIIFATIKILFMKESTEGVESFKGKKVKE